MARGRMLNKSVSLSLKFGQLPDDTCRLLATWIIPQLDYNGVFYAEPSVVRSLVFPRRTDVTPQQIDFYLNAMAEVGLIRFFEAAGQRWHFWPSFADNQLGLRADREATDFPPPPGASPSPDDRLPQCDRNHSGVVPEWRRSDSGAAPAKYPERGAKRRKKPAEIEGEDESEPEMEREGEPESPSDFTISSIQEIAQLFDQDRISRHQAAVLRQIHDKYGSEPFRQALEWAAAKGMTVGQAIVAVSKALPTWEVHSTAPRTLAGLAEPGQAGHHPPPAQRWFTEEEFQKYFLHPPAPTRGPGTPDRKDTS